jgi:hypothetical protein
LDFFLRRILINLVVEGRESCEEAGIAGKYYADSIETVTRRRRLRAAGGVTV